MQALTNCKAKFMSTCATTSQSKGAMEEMSLKVQNAALTFCDAEIKSTRTTAGQFKGQFNGAMDEMSGKVQNPTTHRLRRKNYEHAHSSRSDQGSVQGGDGGHV